MNVIKIRINRLYTKTIDEIDILEFVFLINGYKNKLIRVPIHNGLSI
jgi:hypothetical protein